jgi:hypothetical protein
LLVATAADTLARQGIGTNNHVLTAASGETNGLKWSAINNVSLGDVGSWTSYTPVLTASTNPTLGAGSVQSGSYARIQNLIIYRFFILFGTSGVNAGAGNYQVSLPIAAAGVNQYYENNVGQVGLFDLSANTMHFSNAWIADVNNVTLTYHATFNGALNNVTHLVPFAPAASDAFSGIVIYRAA